MGTWRLVRTPNPRGGADAVSIMQTADLSRSDINLAGMMLRCREADFDVAIVLLEPFPPRARPKVRLTTSKGTVELPATVVPPGAALSLPGETSTLVKGSWQSVAEVALEVMENDKTVRGVVSLTGLASALALLLSNCPSR